MILTLVGSNTYALDTETSKIVDEFVRKYGDSGVEKLDGSEIDLDRLNQAIYSVPFLSPQKLVILKNASKNLSIAQELIEQIDKLPEDTDLVIVEPSVDKRTALYKALKKKTEFRELNTLDRSSLVKWVINETKSKNGIIGNREAELLVDRVGLDQLLLASEINKLIIYNPNIAKDSILELTEANPQSTIFDLLEAAFKGRLDKIDELYTQQREMGVDPQQIIGLITWQLQVIALIKYSEQTSADAVASITKLNPYVVRKSQAIANGLTTTKLKQLVTRLSEIDVSSKNISIDVDSALQTYLISLSSD